MTQTTRIRQALRAWDDGATHRKLDEMERSFVPFLRDLGIPPSRIDFARTFNIWGITSSLHIPRNRSEEFLDYDVVMQHPWADIATPDFISISNSLNCRCHDVSVSCTISIHVTLPEQEKQTLWNIGKIKMEPGYVSEPAPQLQCGMGVPF